MIFVKKEKKRKKKLPDVVESLICFIKIITILFVISIISFQAMKLCMHAIDTYEPVDGIKNQLFGPYYNVPILDIIKHNVYVDIVFVILIPLLFIVSAGSGTFGVIVAGYTVLWMAMVLISYFLIGVETLFKLLKRMFVPQHSVQVLEEAQETG